MKNCRVAQAFLEAGYWCHEVGKKRRTSQPALEGSTFGYAYIPLVATPKLFEHLERWLQVSSLPSLWEETPF